jgi:hypothetical protein
VFRYAAGVGKEFFVFATASRLFLWPIQPSIQWESGALSAGEKRHRREADHSPSSSAKLRLRRSIHIQSPIHFHGTILSETQGQFDFAFTLSNAQERH